MRQVLVGREVADRTKIFLSRDIINMSRGLKFAVHHSHSAATQRAFSLYVVFYHFKVKRGYNYEKIQIQQSSKSQRTRSC